MHSSAKLCNTTHQTAAHIQTARCSQAPSQAIHPTASSKQTSNSTGCGADAAREPQPPPALSKSALVQLKVPLCMQRDFPLAVHTHTTVIKSSRQCCLPVGIVRCCAAAAAATAAATSSIRAALSVSTTAAAAAWREQQLQCYCAYVVLAARVAHCASNAKRCCVPATPQEPDAMSKDTHTHVKLHNATKRIKGKRGAMLWQKHVLLCSFCTACQRLQSNAQSAACHDSSCKQPHTPTNSLL